jgi:hypothetical protein
MSCEEKQQAFKDALEAEQVKLKAELEAITTDTAQKAKDISDDFESDNDLAAGVGAAAGTAIGGYIGGPAGAAVGNVVGKQIGSLFTLEVGIRRETIVLYVPQVAMRTQDFSFDLPTVIIRDADLSFDLPTIEMRRQRGPDIPQITVRMETRCTPPPIKICTDFPISYTEMVPTYLDVPVTVMRTNHIVVGLPTIEMRRQEIKLDIPEFRTAPVEFSADVPYVTLRFIKDAGKRTAAQAAALAQAAQDAAAQKQIVFKDRLRNAVAPLAISMFDCYRETITSARTEAASRFADEINKLSNSVAGMISRGIPEGDATLSTTRQQLDDAIARRDAAVNQFDASLTQLNRSAQAALEQFLGSAPKGADHEILGLLLKTSKTMPKDGSKPPATNGLVIYYALGANRS